LQRQLESKNTFRPNCNTNKNYQISISFEERQKIYREKSENRKLQVVYEMNKNETKGKQLFKPQTNMTHRVNYINKANSSTGYIHSFV
jgi:hypothetical protein